jgi:HNH endonuclease
MISNLSVRERLEKLYIPEPNSGCWIWIGSIESLGYGRFKPDGRRKSKMKKAHVVSYQEFKCDVPDGLELDHLCRVRCCINPEHLEPVTRKENIRRSPIALAAIWARRTHCSNGHPLSGDNLVKTTENRRRCRICLNKRYREKRYWDKKKWGK